MNKKQSFLKLTVLFFILLSHSGFAQNKKVTGVVTDISNIPIPGVNIILKGTQKGAITNFDGEYSISVTKGQTLVFSYIGFKTKEIVVGSASSYNVSLQTADNQLEEIVIVGYGTQKKSDITGAVSSISKERLDMIPNTNAAQALQGSVSGVVINNNSSSASGGDISITVRGANSILASTSPLIILDGFPYSGSFSDINPIDIASIEVLKDASSAAIYGSRAANGVILITSKKGKEGKVKFNYDVYYGVSNASNIPDVLSAEEFYQFKLTRDPNSFDQSELDIYNSGEGVDWVDLALRTGTTAQHNLSVSGGSERFKYYISGTLLDVQGIRLNDDFQRSTLRFNLESQTTDWLKIGTNTQLSYRDASGLGPSWSDVFYMNPLTKSHDENGNLTIYPWEEDVYFANPLENTIADNSDVRYKIISNFYLDFDLGFVPGLSYRLNTGLEYTHTKQGTYWGANTKTGLENQGVAEVRNDLTTNTLLENIVNYKKQFGKHNIFLTGLYSYQQEITDNHDLDSQGFPSDVLTWRQANVAALVSPDYLYRDEVLLSSMLRLNYGYNDKYLLTLTGRRDGFSAFGDDTKFGNFYSAAVAWNVHNESFMENSIFNTLKFRASYGEVGNQAVNAYDSLTLLLERSYVDQNGNQLPGYITDNELGNPLLGWETSKSFNIGVDFGLLRNKISGNINVYKTNTYDLLANQSISAFHGATEINTNLGQIQNQGLEIALSAKAIQTKDFSWNIDGNISFNKNEWVDIFGDGGQSDDVGNNWFIGQPTSIYYAYQFDGVFQLDDDIANSPQPDAAPGFAKVKDQLTIDSDGDGVLDTADGEINADDRVIIGQRDPKTVAALSMNFKYKNFGLYIMSQGAFGYVKQNGLKSDDVWTEVRRNTVDKNWWSPENPSNDFYANAEGANIDGVNFYESGDYWRVKDITLSYELDQKILNSLKIEKFRVYLTGRNLLTFTDYEGLDPEFTVTRSTPLQKTFTLGLNINF